MPEPGHTPTGETTLLPPIPGFDPAEAGAKVLLPPAADAEVLPPEPTLTPGPARPLPPRGPRRPVGWWVRRLVPVGGLALFLACLYALLDSFPPPGGAVTVPRAPDLGGSLPAVVIDPGHGGIDTGAIALGLQEKGLNLDVALRVTRFLEARGIPVRMTRYADQAVSLEDRVRIANAAPGAIFVSIHFNDAPSTSQGQSYHASGVETYYSEHKEVGTAGDWMWTSLFGGRNSGTAAQRAAMAGSVRGGAELADAIQGSLVLATSAADRGIKERGLYVTRRVRGPAVLVEGGFISHPTEAKHLGEPTYRQKLAEAISAGIMKYLATTSQQPVSNESGNLPPGT